MLNSKFAGWIFLLLFVVGAYSSYVDEIKQFYNTFQKVRQCRYQELEQCLQQTWKHFECKFKDIHVTVRSENPYMLARSSLNRLSGSYTPRNARMDIFFTPNDEKFVATEELSRYMVGDKAALQKTCFVQEIRKCLHDLECGVPFHTQAFKQIFYLAESPWSQLYNTAALYVKEKWQQFKDWLFGEN